MEQVIPHDTHQKQYVIFRMFFLFRRRRFPAELAALVNDLCLWGPATQELDSFLKVLVGNVGETPAKFLGVLIPVRLGVSGVLKKVGSFQGALEAGEDS